MRMTIDALGLEAFLAIAEQGRFHKAARELHLTQTALSRRLQNFEAQLGVTLVEIRETGRAQRGDVTIACVPTAGVQFLPRILKEYAERHPGNCIKVLDHASSGVTGAVLRREAEFGIQIGGPHPPELESVPVLEDRFVLICRDDHALAGRTRLTWRQLESHPLVFVGAESGNRPLLDTALAAERPRLQARYEVQRSSTAVGLVAAGVAAAIVPSLALQEGAHPRLRVIPVGSPVVSRTLVRVKRKGASLSPAAQALFELVRA
jgi:DNA-binding transcriptional LysR family regulator